MGHVELIRQEPVHQRVELLREQVGSDGDAAISSTSKVLAYTTDQLG
jgi:hypothetical protein